MKKREGSRLLENRKDKDGNLICLIPTCNKLRQKYKKGNRYRNYCEDHGWQDIGEFVSWQSLRKKALKRDNYTCVKCGDNREEVETVSKQKRIKNWDGFMSGKEKIQYEYYDFSYNTSNFVVDHIIPIALGGDEWDMDNLQTLCLACNKPKTSNDIKKISALRAKEKLKIKIENYKRNKTLNLT